MRLTGGRVVQAIIMAVVSAVSGLIWTLNGEWAGPVLLAFAVFYTALAAGWIRIPKIDPLFGNIIAVVALVGLLTISLLDNGGGATLAIAAATGVGMLAYYVADQGRKNRQRNYVYAGFALLIVAVGIMLYGFSLT